MNLLRVILGLVRFLFLSGEKLVCFIYYAHNLWELDLLSPTPVSVD